MTFKDVLDNIVDDGGSDNVLEACGYLFNFWSSSEYPFISEIVDDDFKASYYVRSYSKTLAPMWYLLADALDMNISSDEFLNYIGGNVINRYGVKWQALYEQIWSKYPELDPLITTDITTTRTPDLSYKEDETSDETSQTNRSQKFKTTTSMDSSSDSTVFGFNSDTAVGDSGNTASQNLTSQGDQDDNASSDDTTSNRTTANTRTETGSETTTRQGLEGGKSRIQLWEEYVSFADKNSLYEMIFSDMDRELFLQVY